MDLSTIIRPEKLNPAFTLPFNYKVIDGSFFVTNYLGDYIFLEPEEFRAFVEGDVEPKEPLYQRLKAKNMLADEVDTESLAHRFRNLKSFIHHGPVLHAFVLTERCNHGCQYCHSSIVGMKNLDTDMPKDVAERGVDMALSTTANGLTIEFQGGEPTANWDTLTHIVEYAQEKNRFARKDLSMALVTNFSLLDDERLDFLIKNRVQICTSLDGPEDLHNKIRLYKDGNSWQLTVDWMKKVNQRYVDLGLDPNLYRVEALPTITRDSLGRWKEIVDTYVELGCRALFLRKLDPYGFAALSAKKLGYSMNDFLDFYRKALDYIIELNFQGVQIMERHAAIMLSKIVANYDPNYLDLRSPGGAVLGQLAYHPDGSIYSSDEGRMVAAMGDEMFKLGDSQTSSYGEIMTHPTTKALVIASTNDGQPGCASCVYRPYCGQQPEYNYTTQGSLFGQMANSVWCQKHMGMFDYLAHRLKNASPEEMKIYWRWTTNRNREHFLQE